MGTNPHFLQGKQGTGDSLFPVLQLAAIHVPFLNPAFKTQPLSVKELALVLVLSSIVFFAVEPEKFIKRKQKIA